MKPQGKEYWQNRTNDDPKRDWSPVAGDWVEDYWGSQSHPHRQLVVDAIGHLEPFTSILEVGCNCGPNLAVLRNKFQYLEDSKLAGIDISPDAIRKAATMLPALRWFCGSMNPLPFYDGEFDIVLSDAALMYIAPDEIEATIDELSRVAGKAIVLLEWDNRSTKGVVKNFHWARNYAKLLKQRGFTVTKVKIAPEVWPAEGWAKNGYLYTALKKGVVEK